MTDIDIKTTPPGTYDVSTTLTPDKGAPEVGQGTPSLTPDKPETLQDVLADEVKRARESDKADAAAAKGKDEAKPEGKADDKAEAKTEPKDGKAPAAKPAKPAKDEAEPGGQGDGADPAVEAKDEGRDGDDPHPEAPSRFTDEARKVYRNVPRAVKAEIARMEAEITQSAETHREASRLHGELRDYDGLARRSGTSIKAALDRYTAFDRAIQEDFGKGIATIAKDAGHSPEATVAQLLRAYGTTPEKYAQLVLKNPAAHQVQAPPQRDPMIAQIAQQNQLLMQRLEQQDSQQKLAETQAQVDEWAKNRPDYPAMQATIAEIIRSGIVEKIHGSGLSLVQRLEAAYRIAGGKAGQTDPSAAPANPGPRADDPVDPDAGKKSVRGAPSNGLTPTADDPQENMQDFLRRELRKLRA